MSTVGAGSPERFLKWCSEGSAGKGENLPWWQGSAGKNTGYLADGWRFTRNWIQTRALEKPVLEGTDVRRPHREEARTLRSWQSL
jgi:hypothetical protein